MLRKYFIFSQISFSCIKTSRKSKENIELFWEKREKVLHALFPTFFFIIGAYRGDWMEQRTNIGKSQTRLDRLTNNKFYDINMGSDQFRTILKEFFFHCSFIYRFTASCLNRLSNALMAQQNVIWCSTSRFFSPLISRKVELITIHIAVSWKKAVTRLHVCVDQRLQSPASHNSIFVKIATVPQFIVDSLCNFYC